MNKYLTTISELSNGLPYLNEYKSLCNLAKRGTHRGQGAKDSISKILTSVPKPLHSDDHRKNLSKACKGTKGTMLGKSQPLLSCVFCRKSGRASAIKQHYFDKCGRI